MPPFTALMTRLLRSSVIAFCLALGFSTPAIAQQTNDPRVAETIARMTVAYGGERFLNMSTAIIKSDLRLAWPGQGQTSEYVNFVTDRQHKYFDLEKRHGSVERWIEQNGNVFHNRFVVDQTGASNLEYFTMSKGVISRSDFYQVFSYGFRHSDVLTAHFLATNPGAATYDREDYHHGELHDVLRFEIAEGELPIWAYVSRKDGLITLAKRMRSLGAENFVFSSHRQTDGVTFAQEVRVFMNGELVTYDQKLTFQPNGEVSSHIAIEDGFSPPAQMIDNSAMTVDAIGPGLFQVGQEDYSAFVEHDGGLIAINAYGGLTARYDALAAELGSELPLQYMIVTHNHSDHMSGIDEAIALGATLLVTPETETLLKTTRPDIPAGSIQVISDGMVMGSLTIYLRASSHALQNAFVFHQGARALYQDDHYSPSLPNRASRVQPAGLMLRDFVNAEGLIVDTLLNGHSRKAEKWTDFVASAGGASSVDTCPSRRAICNDQ